MWFNRFLILLNRQCSHLNPTLSLSLSLSLYTHTHLWGWLQMNGDQIRKYENCQIICGSCVKSCVKSHVIDIRSQAKSSVHWCVYCISWSHVISVQTNACDLAIFVFFDFGIVFVLTSIYAYSPLLLQNRIICKNLQTSFYMCKCCVYMVLTVLFHTQNNHERLTYDDMKQHCIFTHVWFVSLYDLLGL